jgi:hypothetical protein
VTHPAEPAHGGRVNAIEFRFLVLMKYVVVILAVVTAQAVPAFAGQIPTADPVAEAPIRIGMIALDPHIAISNVGVDTNAFNSRDDPQSDFTFTVAPGSQLFMRTGRGLLSLDGNVEFVYFNEFDTERSVNSFASGQYEFRFNRMRPYLAASTVNTRQRPGFEIDARARHYETEFRGGTDLRTGSKGTVRAQYRWHAYSFAGDAFFNGRPLNQELNRTMSATELSFRQRLTALTTWVTRVSYDREHFEFDDARNAESVRLSSGFELGRLALIRGTAFVGYRSLRPVAGGIIPEFTGVTADTNVSYSSPTQTRLSAQVRRDVEYSYERATPFYVLSSWTATLTQRIIGRWDAQLGGGRDHLAYRALIESEERTDKIGRFGGGVGYNFADDVRVSFDVTSFYRRSIHPGLEYGGVRAGLSATYGY